MKSVQKIAMLIKANQAIILPFFVHLQLWIFFWWIHWDVLKNIHIGLHIMQFILILLTVCKQKLKTRCNCVQLPNRRFWFWHPWMCLERGYRWRGVLLLILLWNIILAFVWRISWNMEEIWTKGFTWLPLFLPHLGNNKRSENQQKFMIVMPWVNHTQGGSLRTKTREGERWSWTSFVQRKSPPSGRPSKRSKYCRSK